MQEPRNTLQNKGSVLREESSVVTTMCIVGESRRTDDRWTSPKDTFCGKVVENIDDWCFAADTAHMHKPLCKDCLASDDYALFLLGDVGEAVRSIFDGINWIEYTTDNGLPSLSIAFIRFDKHLNCLQLLIAGVGITR